MPLLYLDVHRRGCDEALWIPFYLIRGEYLVRRMFARPSYVRGLWLLNGLFGSLEEVAPKRPLELEEGALQASGAKHVLDFRIAPDEAERRVFAAISDVGFWGKLAAVTQGASVSTTPFYAQYCIEDGKLFDPFCGAECTDPLLLGFIAPRPEG
ncbi:hypothetical protein TheveDRAFT_1053 [Thermanaerovibrio velox DSM 12556]|uniref:Uncharacterized protein n=1 Tax=Thermanaerovibrio velox DSM 12556 TaxID=926567 RepID=H0US92_9BACT|nr:hypothetical protein TheveDRAFT_1053 [Thermanaerovibrio velox DSM 12556]